MINSRHQPQPIHFFFAALVALPFSLCGEVNAGIIEISEAKPGTVAAFYVPGTATSPAHQGVATVQSDGRAIHIIPRHIQTSRDRLVKAYTDTSGRDNYDIERFSDTIASAEPFTNPLFIATSDSTRIVTIVNVDLLASENLMFDLGDSFDVVSGQIAPTMNLAFLDGSSLSADVLVAAEQLLDPMIVSNLPEYTGTVAVSGFATGVIPEPSTFVLLGIGGVALVGYGWRRKQQQAA